MHVAAFEAAGEEDAGGAFDEVGEAVAGAFDDGVVGVARVADPGVGGGVPAQVAAEDDADVVELEALGGVDAADLVDAVRIGGPEVRGRDAGGEAAGIGLGVPGHLPGADGDVVDEGAVGVRVGPAPAEAGGQAGGVSIDRGCVHGRSVHPFSLPWAVAR